MYLTKDEILSIVHDDKTLGDTSSLKIIEQVNNWDDGYNECDFTAVIQDLTTGNYYQLKLIYEYGGDVYQTNYTSIANGLDLKQVFKKERIQVYYE